MGCDLDGGGSIGSEIEHACGLIGTSAYYFRSILESEKGQLAREMKQQETLLGLPVPSSSLRLELHAQRELFLRSVPDH